MRAETGPMQFGDDWPGLFIRGDNAAYYAQQLESILSGKPDVVAHVTVAGLVHLLRGCLAGACDSPQSAVLVTCTNHVHEPAAEPASDCNCKGKDVVPGEGVEPSRPVDNT